MTTVRRFAWLGDRRGARYFAVFDALAPTVTARGVGAARALALIMRTGASGAMDRYAAGEVAAFAELYDQIAPRLYGYLHRRTRDGARTEDLLQQTLLQVHRGRSSFIPGADVMPWVFSIARRLVIDGARQAKREVALACEDAGSGAVAKTDAADELVQGKELALRLERELARLPEPQRVAFELLKQDGLSLAEVAEMLGITVGAVKLRVHRANEALRAVLDEEAR